MNKNFFYFLVFFNFFVTKADESLEETGEIISESEKNNSLEGFFKRKKDLWSKLSNDSKNSCPFCK